MINLGLLVTYIQTPSPPAVGLRRCMRIRIPTDPAPWDGGTSSAVQPVGARAGPYAGEPACLCCHGHCAGARFNTTILLR